MTYQSMGLKVKPADSNIFKNSAPNLSTVVTMMDKSRTVRGRFSNGFNYFVAMTT